MPEILTMIQIQRFTPTPAVLAMALLSMLYLTVSDIFALINYVGFATWVCKRKSLQKIAKFIYQTFISVKYWSGCSLLTMATMGSTKSSKANQSSISVSRNILTRIIIRHCCTHVCQSCGDWLWRFNDLIQHSRLFRLCCLEK